MVLCVSVRVLLLVGSMNGEDNLKSYFKGGARSKGDIGVWRRGEEVRVELI